MKPGSAQWPTHRAKARGKKQRHRAATRQGRINRQHAKGGEQLNPSRP